MYSYAAAAYLTSSHTGERVSFRTLKVVPASSHGLDAWNLCWRHYYTSPARATRYTWCQHDVTPRLSLLLLLLLARYQYVINDVFHFVVCCKHEKWMHHAAYSYQALIFYFREFLLMSDGRTDGRPFMFCRCSLFANQSQISETVQMYISGWVISLVRQINLDISHIPSLSFTWVKKFEIWARCSTTTVVFEALWSIVGGNLKPVGSAALWIRCVMHRVFVYSHFSCLQQKWNTPWTIKNVALYFWL